MSLRFAVLVREGRDGGEEGAMAEEDVPLDLSLGLKECSRGSSFCLLVTANGSCSGILGDGVRVVVEMCLRTRGLGFWSELRTRGEVV
jgi:hypothetical protein